VGNGSIVYAWLSHGSASSWPFIVIVELEKNNDKPTLKIMHKCGVYNENRK
jgi:hypothetical protein